MNYKEELEYLKENDPITYYELTGNPTGSDYDDFGVGCVIYSLIAIITGIITILILLIK